MGFIPKDYVPVHTRVQQIHNDNKEASIITSYELVGDTVIFHAIVKTEKGEFHGTSFGSTKREKALEKLETVAVGRASAFAGYEIKGGLASRDEMQNFTDNQKCIVCGSKTRKPGKEYCSPECHIKDKDLEDKIY